MDWDNACYTEENYICKAWYAWCSMKHFSRCGRCRVTKIWDQQHSVLQHLYKTVRMP